MSVLNQISPYKKKKINAFYRSSIFLTNLCSNDVEIFNAKCRISKNGKFQNCVKNLGGICFWSDVWHDLQLFIIE